MTDKKMITHLAIEPLQPPDELQDYEMDKFFNPILPSIKRQRGSLICLLASTMGGKTTIINNLIFRFWKSPTSKPTFAKILFYSPTVYNDDGCRFIREYCECHTLFDEDELEKIVKEQESYSLQERPRVLLIIDDHVGLIKNRGRSKISAFFSRMRHYNMSCIISLQYLKDLAPVVRTQLSCMLILNVNSEKQKDTIAEIYGGMFGSKKIFYDLLNYATRDAYSFLYLKFKERPCEAYKCFTEPIDWVSKVENDTTMFDTNDKETPEDVVFPDFSDDEKVDEDEDKEEEKKKLIKKTKESFKFTPKLQNET
tara:strand:- start:2 stop:934 length:933 start_codon:yes stop_codon:yes gene_type:complete